jgi:hypothetical protein
MASEKGGSRLVSSTTDREFIQAVAAEMASGIDGAVEHWLGKIDGVLPELQADDPGKTAGSSGGPVAIQEIGREDRTTMPVWKTGG